jgi:hypothetical protein
MLLTAGYYHGRDFGALMAACIEDPLVVIRQVLDHLRQKVETSEPSVLPESRAPPVGLTHGLFY